jgi:anti-sigma B factor antagonist
VVEGRPIAPAARSEAVKHSETIEYCVTNRLPAPAPHHESDIAMQVSVAHRPPNTAVLILRGSLDIDTAPSLKANLNRLVERPSPRVVVDLSGLDFCDSMGVGVLVTAHGRAMERGGWVRLAAPSGFLRRLLDTLGLTGYLSLHHDVDAALTE